MAHINEEYKEHNKVDKPEEKIGELFEISALIDNFTYSPIFKNVNIYNLWKCAHICLNDSGPSIFFEEGIDDHFNFLWKCAWHELVVNCPFCFFGDIKNHLVEWKEGIGDNDGSNINNNNYESNSRNRSDNNNKYESNSRNRSDNNNKYESNSRNRSDNNNKYESNCQNTITDNKNMHSCLSDTIYFPMLHDLNSLKNTYGHTESTNFFQLYTESVKWYFDNCLRDIENLWVDYSRDNQTVSYDYMGHIDQNDYLGDFLDSKTFRPEVISQEKSCINNHSLGPQNRVPSTMIGTHSLGLDNWVPSTMMDTHSLGLDNREPSTNENNNDNFIHPLNNSIYNHSLDSIDLELLIIHNEYFSVKLEGLCKNIDYRQSTPSSRKKPTTQIKNDQPKKSTNVEQIIESHSIVKNNKLERDNDIETTSTCIKSQTFYTEFAMKAMDLLKEKETYRFLWRIDRLSRRQRLKILYLEE